MLPFSRTVPSLDALLGAVRLREEFMYVAVVLDAWSRKAVGWALSRTMEESGRSIDAFIGVYEN